MFPTMIPTQPLFASRTVGDSDVNPQPSGGVSTSYDQQRGAVGASSATGPLLPDARIRVVGVGGAGGNALTHMHAAGLGHVGFVAMNTDAQALGRVAAHHHIHLGQVSTRGTGAGGVPQMGARAAEESENAIRATLEGAELVFITLGLGGGTGTGAGPVVAQIARGLGALVVGVVTLPFGFEGRKRAAIAQAGLETLGAHVDTLITIPNDRIFGTSVPRTTLSEALRVSDEVLRQGVAGVADLVTSPGLINLDLADLRSVMTGAGTALLAIGEADGEDRALRAAHLAMSSPLLGLEAAGAHGLVCNITGGEDLTLFDVRDIMEQMGETISPDATLIFGAINDPAFTGRIRVTVIATGIQASASPRSTVTATTASRRMSVTDSASFAVAPGATANSGIHPIPPGDRGAELTTNGYPDMGWQMTHRPSTATASPFLDPTPDTAWRQPSSASFPVSPPQTEFDATPSPRERLMVAHTIPLTPPPAPPAVRSPVGLAWQPPEFAVPPLPIWANPTEPLEDGPPPALPATTDLLPPSGGMDPQRTRVTHDSSLIPTYLRRLRR